MTTQVEIEQIEATKSEKFLAVVLAAFLLVGGVWFYVKSDDWVRDAIAVPRPTASGLRALQTRATAGHAVEVARLEQLQAQRDLELAREAYRTALDEGRSAPALRRGYERAQERLDRADGAVVEAEQAARRAEPAAERAAEDLSARQHRAEDRRAWVAALLRFAFVAVWVVLSARLLTRLRRRESRYLPLAFAAVGCGALLTLVFAADYVTDYVDPLDLGPLLLSLVGIAVTLIGFVALQRYLAARIPARRVRKAECPFCGYPVRGQGPHCEGCGREVIGECTTCGRPRRVGAARCAACGAA